jgi:hypothetical protein
MAFSPGSWMIGLQLGGQQKRACRAVGLQGGPGLWRTVVDAKNVLTLHCSLRPCERKVDIGLLLFFGFGLKGPTRRFFGILPELASLCHFDTLVPTGRLVSRHLRSCAGCA